MGNKSMNMSPNMLRALQNAKGIKQKKAYGGTAPTKPVRKQTGGGCGCGK
tara:strand:- start:111 stop:260 length:150 start_codon:yes stop_codon:yes gene_type:complete